MLTNIICIALNVYLVILIARIILTWVPSLPDPLRPLARVLSLLTDPVLTPLRGLLPPVRIGAAALDLSPILVFFAISILSSLLC